MAYDRDAAETIETITDTLRDSERLDDIRDACRALKSSAKKYRVEVSKAMDLLLQTTKIYHQDKEIVNYCLGSLNYIISGELGDSTAANLFESELPDKDPGRELSEMFLKKAENVITILDLIVDSDFETIWAAVRLLCGLARHNLDWLQASILTFPHGVSRLMQLMSEEYEPMRNDALVLFVRLTQSNTDIQNLVAFENGYDKIMKIIESEGHLNGTVVVIDCLVIIQNLIQFHESNQILFREGGNIEKLMSFFKNIKGIQWTNHETTCLVLVLQILGSLVSPSNTNVHVQACQEIMQKCGVLDSLCELLHERMIPIGVLAETLNLASDIVRGHLGRYAHMVMSTESMTPILVLAMVKELYNK